MELHPIILIGGFFPIRETENFERHMVVVEVLVEVASSLGSIYRSIYLSIYIYISTDLKSMKLSPGKFTHLLEVCRIRMN